VERGQWRRKHQALRSLGAAGRLRQPPPSLTENLRQTLQGCPGRILSEQTRPAYAGLKQVSNRMPDSPAAFANSPSLVSQLTEPPCRPQTAQSLMLTVGCPAEGKAAEKRLKRA